MFLLMNFILLYLELVTLVHGEQAATEDMKATEDMNKQRSMVPIRKKSNSATNGIYTLPEKEFQIVLLRSLGKTEESTNN